MADSSAGSLRAFTERCGETVRCLRSERGLTQRELASRTGLQRSYLADVERGGRHISLTSITRIASGLGVPLSAFFARLETLRSDDELR